ncbi:MAG: hypothetical protein U0163_08075 [Gemmatimonadaceae bacterium]
MRHPDAAKSALPRELILHEKWLMQQEWMRQATYVRLSLIGLCLVMGLLDVVADVLPASWEVLIGANAVALAANGLAIWRQRRDRARPWHMWALLCVDSSMIAVLGAAMGAYGYLALPFYLLSSAAYSLTLPRAARVQLAVALVCYPVAREAGAWQVGYALPQTLVVIEEVCLGAIGYLAIAGPMIHVSGAWRPARARRPIRW